MDAVDPALVDRAEAALAGVPGVLAVHRVRMRWVGHEFQADADLELDAGIPLSQAHAIAHRAEAALVCSVPRLTAAVVHAYPPPHSAPSSAWRPDPASVAVLTADSQVPEAQ